MMLQADGSRSRRLRLIAGAFYFSGKAETISSASGDASGTANCRRNGQNLCAEGGGDARKRRKNMIPFSLALRVS
jgi:hypothetical protein